ncbi:MAG: hypothetical protein ACK41Z_13465, partial [Sediminibacterium sp.]
AQLFDKIKQSKETVFINFVEDAWCDKSTGFSRKYNCLLADVLIESKKISIICNFEESMGNELSFTDY